MSANHKAAKKEKLTEKFLLSLVSSITTTICSHNYHLLLLLLFITSSFKLSHLPTYQHHSYLELAISLKVKTIYSCHVSIPPFMEHPLSNFQNPNYKIVQTLDDDLIFIATIISLFKICFSAVRIIFMSFLSRVKLNSTNWPAPNVWVFIAQMIEHCSANLFKQQTTLSMGLPAG